MKLGYKVLVNAHSWKTVEIPLKLCWDNACLPKDGFSLWLAIQNRVLTADRLSKFGFIGPSRCILYKNDNENAEHLFYKCPFAQSCWGWLKSRLSWSSPSPKSFQDFILSWPTHLEYGIYSKLWNIGPSIIVWELWKERNKQVFQDKALSLERFLLKLEGAVVEVLNSHIRKSLKEEGSFSGWDGKMKKNWSNIINPPRVYKKKNKEARANCKWKPLPSGWFKLNFDGVARGNPGIAGIGCIINDDRDRWIGKLASPLPLSTNNSAELEAVDKGLQLCISLGVSKVIIEGDS